MRFSDWLRRGILGALGIVGCGGDIDLQSPKDNAAISQTASSLLLIPQFSELEKKVSSFSPEKSYSTDLLEFADYGERFYGSVSLFIGNYTLGVSSGW